MGPNACAGVCLLALSLVYYLFRNVANPFYLRVWGIDTRRFNWHGVPLGTIILLAVGILLIVHSAITGR